MRKVNARISVAIIILFLIHGIAGGYQMAGILDGGNQALTVLAWILVGLIGVHAVIGTILSVESIRISKKSGKIYPRENALFILRRISGFAILLFAVSHILIFYGNHSSGYRLNLFEGPQLALSIALLVSIAVHLLCNIKPLFIGLGISAKNRRKDLIIILAVILVFCAVMFAVYYYRWNIGWKWNIHLGS